MLEDDELYSEEPLPPRRWSWWWVAAHGALCARDILASLATFCEEGLADGFAACDNRKIDQDELADKREMATDVLADLEALP